MKQRVQRTVLVLSLAGLSGAVCAQTYVGGDVGSTKVDGFTSASGYGLFGGYTFNGYFSAEAGYRRLGRFEVETSKSDTVRINLAQVSALGHYPLSDVFKLYGRLGYGALNASGYSSYNLNSGVIYGVGAQYAFTKNWAARLEYSRVASDTKQANLGLAYKF